MGLLNFERRRSKSSLPLYHRLARLPITLDHKRATALLRELKDRVHLFSRDRRCPFDIIFAQFLRSISFYFITNERVIAKEYFGPIDSAYLENIIPVKTEIPSDSPKQILFLQVPTSSPERTAAQNSNQGAVTSDKSSTVKVENGNTTASKRPKKVQRSNQHNVIEKRYR